MLGSSSRFAGPHAVACVLALVASGVATAVAVRRRRSGRPWLSPASLVLSAGVAVVVLVTTASPSSWPPVLQRDGDLVLALGSGGLSRWHVLAQAPASSEAVLLVGNVLLYVPLGLLLVLGWPRPVRALAAASGLSLLVDQLQWQVLGRVAATDDVLLNTSGALLGVARGLAGLRTLAVLRTLAGR